MRKSISMVIFYAAKALSQFSLAESRALLSAI